MFKINYHPRKFAFLLLQLFLIAVGLLAVYALTTQKFIIQKRASPYASRLDLPATLNAVVGSDINVPIFLSTKGASIVGVDVVISFDRGRLILVDITTDAKNNTSLKTFAPVDASKNFDKAKIMEKASSTGVIDFGAVAFDSASGTKTSALNTGEKSVVLSTLKFRPRVAGTTSVSFNFTSGSTTDSNIVIASNPPVDTLEAVTNLSMQITGGPTATPGSATRTPMGTVVLDNCSRKAEGDANCDLKVNGIDYSLWLNSQCRMTAAQSCASARTDFNADGNTDDSDYNIWFGKRGT